MRAATSVTAVVLMVAVVVVLAGTVAVFTLGSTDTISSPAPLIGQTSGELVRDTAGGGDQIVRLTRIAGDDVAVSDLDVVVDATAACGKRARIVDLPTSTLGPSTYDGDKLFDFYSPDGGAFDANTDGVWRPGETATFRIANRDCSLDSGDTITVRVVHTPSETVVIEDTLTAS